MRDIKSFQFDAGVLAGFQGMPLSQGQHSSWAVGVHTGRRVIRRFPDPATQCERDYVGVVSLRTQIQGHEHYTATYNDGDAEELDTLALERSLVSAIIPRDVCPFYSTTGECGDRRCSLRHRGYQRRGSALLLLGLIRFLLQT